MNIPRDFESPWLFSDAILLVEDAEGNEKQLHVDKKYLATNSSFFERLFFSEFKEANSESVKVSCSYEIMKFILQIIYGLSRGEFILNETCRISVLMELYKSGDYLDFPLIRNLCTKQMLDRPSVEMATAVLRLANELSIHDTLTDIMKKMSSDDVKQFLSVDDSKLVFSKSDVKDIYELVNKKPIAPFKHPFPHWTCKTPLYDLSSHCESPLIDSSQKWPNSDVLIKTKNSERKELFSSKTVLAMVSPYFAELFLAPQESSGMTEIELDVDYMVMKNILSILHHCYDDGNLESCWWRQLFMNYLMYCAASEEKFNIPKIRKMFSKSMEECMKTRVINLSPHLDIAVKLNLNCAKSAILKTMSSKHLLEWVYSAGVMTSEDFMVEDDSYYVSYLNKDKIVLSVKDVGTIVERLAKEYNE